MVERASVIASAQRARGLDTEGSVRARLRGVLPLVGPVILSSLTEVEERSLALEVRAFGRPGRRHLLWRIPDSRRPARRPRRRCSLALVAAIVVRVTGAFPEPALTDARADGRLVPLRRLRDGRSSTTSTCARRRRDRRARRAERGGQVDALPGRLGARAGVDRRRASTGTLTLDGTPAAGPADPRARRARRRRLPEPEHAAIGDRGDGLRGDRARADEPRARGAPRPSSGRARRSPGSSSSTRRCATRSGCPAARPSSSAIAVAARDAAAPRDPRRADGPARPGRDAARRRGAPAARGDRHVAPDRRAQDRPARRRCCSRIVAIDGGRIVLDGPTGRGLRRPAPGGARRRAAGAGAARRRSRRAGSSRRSSPARSRTARDDADGGAEAGADVIADRGPRPRLRRRDPGARRRRRSRSSAASGSRSSARTGRASRRSSATSTASSGRPRGGSSSTASTPPIARVAAARRDGRPRVPGPGPPDLRRQGPVARSRSGRGTSGVRGAGARQRAIDEALAATGLDRRRRRRTRTTWATRAGSCSRWPRSSRWARRSWSSTSRRPARTPAASSGSQEIVARLSRRGPDGRRDQPRHALRRRGVRADRRHARRPDRPRRHAGRGLRRVGLADARVDVPRAAARRPGSARGSALGSTPTEASLVAALTSRASRASHPNGPAAS